MTRDELIEIAGLGGTKAKYRYDTGEEWTSDHIPVEIERIVDGAIEALEDAGIWFAPDEPSEMMIECGYSAGDGCHVARTVYRAMRDEAKREMNND